MTKPIIHPEPPMLYSAIDVAEQLGVSRTWIFSHMERPGSPPPAYRVQSKGSKISPLWTTRGVDNWRAYHARLLAPADRATAEVYSDHRAVNRVGNVTVTWKLWWQNLWDGRQCWWYSTPFGWYTSEDDGYSWEPSGAMLRPSDNRYYSVSGIPPALRPIVRRSEELRRRLTADSQATDLQKSS